MLAARNRQLLSTIKNSHAHNTIFVYTDAYSRGIKSGAMSERYANTELFALDLAVPTVWNEAHKRANGGEEYYVFAIKAEYDINWR